MRRRDRRGNAAYVVVGALVLLGFSALAVDVGELRLVQAQLQVGADAASHAGASRLDRTEAGLLAALHTARAIASRNRADGRVIELAVDDVLLGVWDGTVFTESADPEQVNAVRVLARRDDIRPLFSGVAFGTTRLAAAADAVAVRPAPQPARSVECYLPLAIPRCLLERHGWTAEDPPARLDLDLVLSPAGIDNVAWARRDGHPSASFVQEHLLDCENDGEVSYGDQVGLDNGTVASALSALADAVEASSSTWDPEAYGELPGPMDGSSIAPSLYGRTVEGSILVFDGGEEYCTGSGGPYTGSESLVGFVWAAVFDVRATGPASSKNIRTRLDFSRVHEVGTEGGGSEVSNVNIWYVPPPRIVQ